MTFKVRIIDRRWNPITQSVAFNTPVAAGSKAKARKLARKYWPHSDYMIGRVWSPREYR